MDAMSAFAQLEEQKAAFLDRLARWSPEQLTFQPAPGEWSSLQVLDHLEKTERSISIAVARNFGKPHSIGLRDRLGAFMVLRIFASRRRVKAPGSVTQIQPSEGVEIATVMEAWAKTRTSLAAILTKAPAAAARAGVFRHPVGGWMTLPQTLRFFSLHVVHHGFQLDRIEQASQGM